MAKLNRVVLHNFQCFPDETFQLDNQGLSLIYGFDETGDANGVGKCLPDSVFVYDPEKKERLSIFRFVKEKRRFILGIKKGKVVSLKVKNWFDLGRKKVAEISLRSGAKILAAETHPFLTAKGCKTVRELSCGDWVAEIRDLPLRGKSSTKRGEAFLLGLLIGDGSIINHIRFTQKDEEIFDVFLKNLKQVCPQAGVSKNGEYGWEVVSNLKAEDRRKNILAFNDFCQKKGIDLNEYVHRASIAQVRRGERFILYKKLLYIERLYGIDLTFFKKELFPTNYLKDWLDGFGLLGCRSGDKFIPDKFLMSSKKVVADLLSGLFLTDGYFRCNKGGVEISYCSKSEQLIKDVRFLLLRLGIISQIRKRMTGGVCYYDLRVLPKFAPILKSKLELVGKKKEVLNQISSLIKNTERNDNLDIIPKDFCCGFGDKEELLVRRDRHRFSRHGMGRETFKNCGGDRVLAESDYFWSPVVKIKYLKKELNCYDIEVDSDEHLYVADTFVSHNSALAIDSITWVLWGVTCKGITGDDVVIDQGSGKNCFVELDFEPDPETKVKVIRYRKHHEFRNGLRLFVNDKEQTQLTPTETEVKLQKYIGVSYEAFINSVLFSPEITNLFSSSTDKERKTLIDSILGYEWADQALEVARKRLKQVDDEADGLALRKAELNSKLEVLGRQKSEAESGQANFEKEKEAKIKDFERKMAVLKEQLTALDPLPLNEKLAGYKKELEEIEEAEKAAVETQQTLQGLEGRIVELETTGQVIGEQIGLANENIKLVRNNEGGACPLCNRKITKAEAPLMIQHYEEEIVKQKGKEKLISADLQQCYYLRKNLLDVLDGEKKKINRRVTVLRDKDFVVARIHELDTKKSEIDTAISLCDLTIKETREGKSPYAEMSARVVKEEKETLANVGEIQEEFDTLNVMRKHLEFWEYGFGQAGIKTFILDSVLPILNERVKYYSEILTDQAIEVKFSAQSLLKSGEVREKIDLSIDNTRGASKYKGNSTGEKRKIDICIMLALHDLIKMRHSVNFNVAFYDEVFAFLSASSIQKVMTLLREEARSKDSVFVISHDDKLKSNFDRVIMIKKEGKISRIVKEV